MTQAHLPDGTILDFPDNTPDSVIDNTVKQHLAPTTLGQDVSTAGRQLEQGLTAGFGDEAIANVAAAGAKGYDKITGQHLLDDQSIQQLYEQSLANQNKDINQDQQKSPYLSLAANLAGGAISGGAAEKGLALAAPEAAGYLSTAGSKTAQAVKNASVGAVQGGLYGAGSADTSNGQSRLEGAEKGALLGAGIGAGGGALLGKEVSAPNPIANTLVNGTELSKNEIGDALGSQIKGAAALSKTAKTNAYNMADAVGDNAFVKSGDTVNLADAIDSSISHLDPELSPAVKQIGKYTSEYRNLANDLDVKSVSYNGLESLRKRLNAIPYTPENAAAKIASKTAFDDHVNNLFEQGLVSGDPEALSAIKDARGKNAYWQQKFNSKDANRVIRNYVKTQGDSLTPENLVDRLTSYTQAGFDAQNAVQDVLGPKAKPMLQQGFMNKIRTASLDSQGNLNPSALAKNIQKFLAQPTLAKSTYSAEEINALKGVAEAANNIQDLGKLKRVGYAVASHAPIFGDMISELAQKAKNTNAIRQIQNSGQTVNYPTLFGMGAKIPMIEVNPRRQ